MGYQTWIINYLFNHLKKFMDSINNFKSLIKAIENTNDFVILKIQKQINVAMTLRN